MQRFIRNTLHPEAYHGQRRQPPFFEGWYFKLIDSTEQHRYAVIPGIFLNRDPEKQHAFVQVLDGQTGASAYYTYPSGEFEAAEDKLSVRVGPNLFTADSISLDLKGEEIAISGQIRFSGLSPWPVSMTSPGIMGWYAWMPFMECYHGVVSLDHALEGTLTINSTPIRFDGGRGYIEKDWGQSFPSAWIWMQTNHFQQPGTCLTASVAMIPWIGRAFRGFIIGFWHDRTLHRFATYTGAKVEKLTLADDQVMWVVRSRTHRLEMLAKRGHGGILAEPTRAEMHRRVMETLQATVDVRLSRIENGREIEVFSGQGRNAGLEVQGDLATLLGQQ